MIVLVLFNFIKELDNKNRFIEDNRFIIKNPFGIVDRIIDLEIS